MRGVNKTITIGTLGADPEVKQFSNGGSVTTISVATSEQWIDKQTGEKREATEWHRISLYQKLGEIAAHYLRKGSQVYIEGSLRTRKYQDQNGQDRYVTEIRADQMQMLGGNQNAQQQNSHQQPSPYAQAALNTAQNVVQNTPVGQAVNQSFANGQSVPPAYQNNPQYAPQNPNQQQPQFQNNMQGEPKPSTVDDDIPFNALNGQLAHLI